MQTLGLSIWICVLLIAQGVWNGSLMLWHLPGAIVFCGVFLIVYHCLLFYGHSKYGTTRGYIFASGVIMLCLACAIILTSDLYSL